MKFSKIILSALAVIALASGLFARASLPMQVRQGVDIPDGETLHYSIYHSGELLQEFTMVTHYNDSNSVKAYLQFHMFSSKTPMPAAYTNYNSYADVNIKTGSQMTYFQDLSADITNQNKLKGQFFQYTLFGDKEVRLTSRFWDGYESREIRGRIINRDPQFPAWDFNSFTAWGARILNWEKPGEVNLVTPVTKEMVKATLYKVKDHIKIITPLGEFDTAKVGLACSDPFLGSLLKQFTDSMFMYVENGPKKRTIKVENLMSNEEWILDGAGIVQ